MARLKYFIIKNVLDPIIKRIRGRIRYMDRLEENQRKEILISKLQSKGYNLRLNGKNHTITNPKATIIGNNVHIGNNAYFSSEGGLIIGDNTHISRNVTIYTQNHNYFGDVLPYDQTVVYKPVTIHKNVWIGMNVSIIPGVTIGEGAIIGLGTLINRNIKPFEVVGSSKSTHLKNRNIEHYKELNKGRKYGGITGKPITKLELKCYKSTYHKNRAKKIVFILSTGRSGSKSIASILGTHSQCLTFHEGIHQLIRLSTHLAHYKKETSVYDELNTIFSHKLWEAEDEVLIHSDQRLWNFVPFLATYFPNSKFVHLKRDPIKSVMSMAARYWYAKNEYPKYNKHDWAKFRLNGYLVGDISEEGWNQWSQIEKCSWYWSYVNTSIVSQLSKISPKRIFTLNLEELEAKILELQDFLEVNREILEMKKSNRVKNIHKTNLESINTERNKKIINEFVSSYNV